MHSVSTWAERPSPNQDEVTTITESQTVQRSTWEQRSSFYVTRPVVWRDTRLWTGHNDQQGSRQASEHHPNCQDTGVAATCCGAAGGTDVFQIGGTKRTDSFKYTRTARIAPNDLQSDLSITNEAFGVVSPQSYRRFAGNTEKTCVSEKAHKADRSTSYNTSEKFVEGYPQWLSQVKQLKGNTKQMYV